MGTEVWVLAQGLSPGQGSSPVGPAGPRSCVPTACLPALPHRPRPQSSFSEGPPPHGHLHLLRCAGPRPDEPSRVQASSGMRCPVSLLLPRAGS